MKKFTIKLLSAMLILSLFSVPEAYAQIRPIRHPVDYIYDEVMPIEYLPEFPTPSGSTAPVYTTLSLGNDFLFQLNTFESAAKALEIYKKFESGLTSQNFNFANLAKQNNMTASGIINADINQGSGNVSHVISQFNSLYRSKLSCTLDSNTTSIFTNTIQTGFNVDTSTKRSFLILTKKSGSSYTYLYKMLAGSLQNINGKTTLTLVPTEITVNVNISIKKILGITIKKKKNFDVHINAYSYSYKFD
jgi:hypothetical protein